MASFRFNDNFFHAFIPHIESLEEFATGFEWDKLILAPRKNQDLLVEEWISFSGLVRGGGRVIMGDESQHMLRKDRWYELDTSLAGPNFHEFQVVCASDDRNPNLDPWICTAIAR
jgi:hypothetical protein